MNDSAKVLRFLRRTTSKTWFDFFCGTNCGTIRAADFLNVGKKPSLPYYYIQFSAKSSQSDGFGTLACLLALIRPQVFANSFKKNL